MTVGLYKYLLYAAAIFLIPATLFSCGETSGGNKAIFPVLPAANWDVVPYQTFSGSMNIGVAAFHESGVRVEFSVNGALIAVETAPRRNPSTASTDIYGKSHAAIYEYYTTLEAADYPDGMITVSATVYADDGSCGPRVLPGLALFTNSGHTLDNDTVKWVAPAPAGSDENIGDHDHPYLTIQKAYAEAGDGGTVCLEAGTYTLESALHSTGYTRWTTVTAAPGVARTDVIIRGNDGPVDSYGGYVRWKNLVLFTDLAESENRYAPIMVVRWGQYIWLDGVEMYDGLGHTGGGGSPFNDEGGRCYMTDCLVRDMGSAGGWWMRNCTIRYIGGDIWRGASDQFLANIDVDFMDPGPTSHPDLLQFWNPDQVVDNIILYNVRATNMNSQGLFMNGGGTCLAANIAFVNLFMEKICHQKMIDGVLTDVGFNWMTSLGEIVHAIFWHCTTVNLEMNIHPESVAEYWNVQNNAFNSFFPPDSSYTTIPSSVVAHNHYARLQWNQTVGMGTEYATGDPLFNAPALHVSGYNPPDPADYKFGNGSPLYHAGIPLECVPADIDGNLFSESTPSLGAFTADME